MNNDYDRNQAQMAKPSHIGVLSAILGLIALGSAAMVGVISFTAFNPPDWARFATFVLFGIGFFGSGIVGAFGLRSPKRTWAVVGLALCVISTMMCVVMLFFGEQFTR